MYVKGASSTSFWRSVSFLLTVVVIVQWILFVLVLHNHHAQLQASNHLSTWGQLLPERKQGQYDGVAVTVMLRAPKWFHRRYTAMLHNTLSNIPPTWAIQVFSNEEWLQKDVLPLHPGLQQLRSAVNNNKDNPRILWTPLPQSMTGPKQKPKDIWKSKWLWESVVAENVLVFSGNGVLCANSNVQLDDFIQYDYVGAPWYQHHGMGGDGSTHSFRHRSAMLKILENNDPPDGGPEHTYFLKHMIQDNNNDTHYNIADRNTTIAFGGVSNSGETPPLVISGTQPDLDWTVREALLQVCPELKIIFPSLHEPSCFGAHPDGETCKKTICALKDKIPGHGC